VGCHPKATEENWELLTENVHSLNHVVEPANGVIRCEDCHAQDCSFDWTAAGYSTQEASQYIWADYPPISSVSYRTEPSWVGVLAIGFAIAVVLNVVVVVVLVTRRFKAG
jgi:hypothetical protein